MIKPLPYISNLVPYVPGKPVEELEREIGITDAIKIASNENPLGPSPKAIESARTVLTSVNRYPDGDCFYLRDKLSHVLGVKKDTLIFGNGSNEVIEIAARTFMKSGDEAIMGEFAFIVYPLVTMALGGEAVVSPMPDMVHDLNDMYKRITPRTRMIFIANPNNPTGTMVDKTQIEWFINSVPKDIIILIDEAYFEYVDNIDYPDTLEYHEMRESLITVRTFSKIYGLAGLRLGYGVTSSEIVSYMNRVREPFNINSIAQNAALSALDDHDHVDNTRKVNNEGMQYLEKRFSELGIKYYKSYANFILIDLGRDPMPLYNALLQKGIIVRPVRGYGLNTHLRISVGLEKENRRLIKALEELSI